MTDDELRKAIRVVRHNPVADVNGAYGWEVDTAEGVLAEAAWKLADYAEAQMGRRCEWVEDSSGDFWQTACGDAHSFMVNGPAENHHQFCPYCGARLIVLPPPLEPKEDTRG